jgi:hypothetical protein
MKQQQAKTNGKPSALRGRKYTRDDFVELSVVATYMVQRRGSASAMDIQSALKTEFGATVHKGTLTKVLDALRKKGFLAGGWGASGEKTYSIKRLKFNLDQVEVPQTGDALFPTLVATGTGAAIKAEIENEQKTGGTNKKPVPEAWADFIAECVILTDMFGAQPLDGNPRLLELYKASKFPDTKPKEHDDNDPFLVFDRSSDGLLMIHTGCVAGFLKRHLRSLGLSEWQIQHFYVQPILLAPETVLVTRRPIQRETARNTGAGFCFYEVVAAGTKFRMKFSAPTKNFVEPTAIKTWLRRILRCSSRTLSPGRGGHTGHCEMVSCRHTLWNGGTAD